MTCQNQRVPDSMPRSRPLVTAILLIVLGVIGLHAAFVLTVERVESLINPGEALSCDFSILVQCGANLGSAQGSIFGFPNSLIGLMAWPIVIFIGVAILAGARFARWFWVGFNLGIAGALAFVIWLIAQSIFVLGTLCPYCMQTWAVVIPLFWMVTLFNLREGHIPASASLRRFSAAAYSWVPVLTLASYLVVAVIAQVQLNVTAYL